MRAAQKAVVGNRASPNLEGLLNLRLLGLGWAGDDRQVFRYLDLVGTAASSISVRMSGSANQILVTAFLQSRAWAGTKARVKGY